MKWDAERVADAIEFIESQGRQNALADAGRALGPFQFHPEAFYDWAPEPYAGEHWSSWFRRAALCFLRSWAVRFPDATAYEAAVVFHRHCALVRASAADFAADNYQARFSAVYQG